MGSVTPLLATAEQLKTDGLTAEFLWLGTKAGPERAVVELAGIKFQPIIGGKWRRYFSLQNLAAPFLVLAGFFQSLIIIIKFKPQVILTAGAFISVPAVWAGRFCRVPVLVHQQDLTPGLANRLMAPFARKITVALEDSLKNYPTGKTSWIGNPVRASLFQGDRTAGLKKFNLQSGRPVVLIVGGGTGSVVLNETVDQALPELVGFCQVIHLTGIKNHPSRRGASELRIKNQAVKGYCAFEFLTTEMRDALAAADIVVSRAGMGFLSELAALGKAVIIVPMADSHQEANASYFARRNAAVVLPQADLTPENLTLAVKNLLDGKSDKANLERNIKSLLKPGAAEAMVKAVVELTKGQ